MSEQMRFQIGDRVKSLVNAPPGWPGAWGIEAGAVGVITTRWDNWQNYGVTFDSDPDRLEAAFTDEELEAAS